MIAPSAWMMLLGAPYAGQRLRKLRFLMTDNSLVAPLLSFRSKLSSHGTELYLAPPVLVLPELQLLPGIPFFDDFSVHNASDVDAQ